MSNNEEENKKMEFNDESGDIHTIKVDYNITKDDGWQLNHADNFTNPLNKNGPTYIKGKQVGFCYYTDDYRKRIPVQIISTILVILISIIMLFVFLPMGIIFSIFSIVWVIGIWAKAPYTKWKNQKAKLENENKESK